MSESPQTHTLKIEVEPYRNLYKRRLHADMVALTIVRAAIQDGSYDQFHVQNSKGQSVVGTLPALDQGLLDYEITKTFISMMRNTNDYLDRMVGVLNVCKTDIPVPRPMSLQEAHTYMANLFDEAMREYCQQTRDEFKDKLNRFGTLPPEFVKYMTTYNILRNCYEHHKATSRKGLQISVKNIGLYTDERKEVHVGQNVEAGTALSVQSTQKTIHVKKGQPAVLTYDDLVSMELYLASEVPVHIEQKVVELIQHR